MKNRVCPKYFVNDCRHIAHNLIWARTIDLQHFEKDSAPGVRVVVNTCIITFSSEKGRYNSEPEHF